MVKQGLIDSTYKFQPRQIVCLEHETTCLYAEVIEFVELRQVCWLRPLMLTVTPVNNELLLTASPESVLLYNLRQGPDLLLPVRLLRLALDTEVIPLLVGLEDPLYESVNNVESHHQLSYFISKVWRTYPKEFESQRELNS